MIDTSTALDLKSSRVDVTLFNGNHVIGVLKGVTETRLWINEESVHRDEILNLALAPLFCGQCKNSVMVLHDELCASCFRNEAKRKPIVREPCVICGDAGIRNPGSDEFLCVRCHAEAGHALRLHGSAAQVLAECLTEDVASSKHEWGQVRGARFRCIRCQKAEKWDPALLRELQERK